MCSGAVAFAGVLGATSGAAGFIVRLDVWRPIAAIRVPVAMNAILAVLPVTPTKAAALIPEFLEGIGCLSEGVRRRTQSVGEAALKTVLAHVLPFGIRSASKRQGA
jgi:hypothetical protein